MKEKIHNNILEKLFEDETFSWVKHHLDTVNLFYDEQISQLFRQHNPIKLLHNKVDIASSRDGEKGMSEYKFRCNLYLGGKNGDKIYIGKPILHDKTLGNNYLYPNEARLKNISYTCSIHYDVDVEFEEYNDEMTELNKTDGETITNIFLGKFPIMLQSNLCILRGLPKEVRYSLGECRNDCGGYFIIDGKEKCIIPQEKFGDNMIYIRDMKDSDRYDYSVEIRSVSEDASKPIRTLKIMREVSSQKKRKLSRC